MEVPSHVAIIMDGNGRWAQQQGSPRQVGHRQGVSTLKEIVKESDRLGIECLTVYAFSTENWKRPSSEVNFLLKLLKKTLDREARELLDNNVVIRIIGRRDSLGQGLLNRINEIEKESLKNQGLQLNIAFNYGGRAEIIDAVNKVLERERLQGDYGKITEEDFSNYLYDPLFTEVDLLIRTGGEHRLSNFLLWQTAYAEIYFTDSYWPEFSREEFRQAVSNFRERDRRFGGL